MADDAVKAPLEERQPWVAQVQKDLRGDDLDMPLNDMVKTYRSTAKERDELKSKSPGLVVPGENAKPEEIAAFKKALGVPDSPDGYTLEIPKGLEDLVKPDEVKNFKTLAHELGITEKAAKKIMEFETKRAQDARKAFVDSQNEEAKKQRDRIIEKYGEKADAKLAAAAKFASDFGGPEAVEGMKTPLGNQAWLIDMLIKAGTLVSEKGITPSGVGGKAEGEVDLKQVYPKSAAQMGLR